MRTILLALMLGLISISPALAGEEAAQEKAACKDCPAACADGACLVKGQPVRRAARVVIAAPCVVVKAGACIVRNSACAVKQAACNARARSRARIACRQARRAAIFARLRACCCCR